jgi:hypothetical protein
VNRWEEEDAGDGRPDHQTLGHQVGRLVQHRALWLTVF